ncbi:MAG: hypothetical protein JSS22_13855 [Proteobacteria bacterium]|nr:hypothetical protein [Pseudomonadota bacterium]
MNRGAQGIALQIVSNDLSVNVVNLNNAADAHNQRHLLNSEALALESEYGKNAYSDYLRKHHKRPTPQEAAGIGRLLGGRVQAEDGSLQPALNDPDRAAIASIKKRRSDASRRYDQIMRLRMAIVALASNRDDPSDVIAGGSVLLNDGEITLHLPDALEWLTRFAEEWENRGKETCAGSEESDGSPKVPNGGKGRDIRINR